ncbi:hypothetical protein ACHAXT_005730 [Thalassiosira profunda]
MSRQPPAWRVQNEGSFASVTVALPPSASFHCESDAVVSMSHTVDVRGAMSGGLLAGLARAFLTRESFFTTEVRNGSPNQTGDVLIAPSDPGGICLHRLARGEELILTGGAYLAGDTSVHVTSSMQSPFSSFGGFSGTGVFLLKASGQGTLAMSAFGSMHKNVLAPGERRMVDNGHLVAWTSSMQTSVKLASRQAGVWGSVTSGEGLHCDFVGPGVVYVQSHKPRVGPDGRPETRGGGGRGGGNVIGACVVFFVFGLILIGILFAAYLGVLAPRSVDYGGGQGGGYDSGRWQHDGGGYKNEF